MPIAGFSKFPCPVCGKKVRVRFEKCKKGIKFVNHRNPNGEICPGSFIYGDTVQGPFEALIKCPICGKIEPGEFDASKKLLVVMKHYLLENEKIAIEKMGTKIEAASEDEGYYKCPGSGITINTDKIVSKSDRIIHV